jgi:hypothetical protein
MGSASRGRDWTPAQAVRLPLDPSGRPTVPSRVFRSRKLAARGMLICWYCCVSVEVRSIHDGPSHASRFVRQRDGHDTRALQAWLGHKNIQHTVRYTELAPDRFRDSGDRAVRFTRAERKRGVIKAVTVRPNAAATRVALAKELRMSVRKTSAELAVRGHLPPAVNHTLRALFKRFRGNRRPLKIR